MASWILLQSWTAFPLCFINRPIKVGTKVTVVPTMNFKSSQLGSNISLLIKIGTIMVNMFLPMRSKFVYSCSEKNPCFGIPWTLGKHFLCPTGCGSISPAKSCWNAWRRGSWLVRGKVNMADGATLHSPICSTFKALVVQRDAGRCCGEELGPFC